MHNSCFEIPTPDWNSIAAEQVEAEPILLPTGQVEIALTSATLRVSFYSGGIRLQISQSAADDFSILATVPELTSIRISGQGQQTTITDGNLTLAIGHAPFSLSLWQGDRQVQRSASDGHFVRQYRLPPLAKTEQGWLLNFELAAEERVYGLGEKWGRLDKRGQLIRSYNHDALGVNAEISYKNTPFAWSPQGWGLFAHTPAPVTHGVGYAPWSQRAYSMLVEDDCLDLFIIAETTAADVLQHYTHLTGRAPCPPEWSLGVILSKAYYKDAEELLTTAKQVRRKKMPCDVITLDGRAWQDTDTRFAFEWDSSRYPDPKRVLDQLKAMNFKICIWEYPLVSVRHPLFQEMADKGWLLKDKRTGQAYQYEWDMSAFGEVLTPLPRSGIVDFTHPDAFAFWRDRHKALFEVGVDMIKADFGEQVEDDNMLSFSGDSGHRLHNVYSLLYNRCVYQAAEAYCPSGAFLFSRSAWTGSQCYPAQWGGDPQADWQGLAASIRGGLSWGLSGGPFYATDVGGFYKDTRDPELFVRWSQAAVFSAHMRLHGIGQREPWSYGTEAEQAVSAALRLRYRLLPYIRQAMMQSCETGLPMQRPMVLAFPQDPLAHGFEHQFMFGEDMLVVPCIEPGGMVRFYLPPGQWFGLLDGREWQGGSYHELQLKRDEMAVFVQAGREVPLGPERTWIDPAHPLQQASAIWCNGIERQVHGD